MKIKSRSIGFTFLMSLFVYVALVIFIVPPVHTSELLDIVRENRAELEKSMPGIQVLSISYNSEYSPSKLSNIVWICFKNQHLFTGFDKSVSTIFHVSSCATGKNPGQKQKEGDMRTPEGNFTVQQIQDASWWKPYTDSQTGDTTGYGPYFIRIKTPGWRGIGIHGTDDDHLDEIGTNASHGCIRLKNDSLIQVKNMAEVGQQIIILQ